MPEVAWLMSSGRWRLKDAFFNEFRLSLPKTLYGANAFEINDIQEQETETSRVWPLQCDACYIALKLATVSIRQGHGKSRAILPPWCSALPSGARARRLAGCAVKAACFSRSSEQSERAVKEEAGGPGAGFQQAGKRVK